MSDSVGKITLDLEVTSDIAGQVNKVSSIIANTLKSNLNNSTNKVFDNMDKTMKGSLNKVNSNMKNMMTNVTNNLKNSLSKALSMLNNIKLPTVKFNSLEPQKTTSQNIQNTKSTRGPPVNRESITTEIDNTARMLDITNAKIESQQNKLISLKEAYNNTFSSTKKSKINEQILKTEESIIRLTSKSDKLGFKLSDLDAKLASLGRQSSATGNKINRLSTLFHSLNSSSNKSNGLFSRMGNGLKSLTSGLNSGSNSTRSFNNGIMGSIGQMFKWMVLFPAIANGVNNMSGSLFASLNTNAQFVNSLNQIKTNLMVAFMPIYQAILPAINALMSALATVTQYVASFISALFGKTYKQSFQAAQGLINAKDAMGAYGKATEKVGNKAEKAGKKAKKALGDLMGFDEINKLNMNDNADTSSPSAGGGGGSGAPILAQPLLDTSMVDAKMKAWVDKVKAIMSKIFEPFANAWNKEGQNTINAIKYSLKGIWELTKAIGSSFLEVWTNGSGERILILLLQILQNIFNIVGDIANTFARAWKENEIGTKIIQGIANVIENLLTIVKKVGDSFREVWGVIGEPLAKSFLKMIEANINLWDKLTEKLIYVWDNGGSHLFKGFVTLGAKIFELASYIYTDFIAPFASWFIDIMAPAIAPLMDNLGSLFDKFSELIDWLLNDGKPVLDTIISTVIGLGSAFMAVKKGIKIFTSLKDTIDFVSLAVDKNSKVFDVLKGASGLLGNGLKLLTGKMGLIVLAIGAVIAIGVYLVTHWDELKVKAIKVWDSIKEKFNSFKNWLGNVFATDWSKRFGGFGDILNGFLANVRNIFKSVKQIFRGIIDFVAGTFTGDWKRAWTGVKNIFGGIMNGLKSVIRQPLNGVISLVNAAISGLNRISVNIPDWVPGKYSGKKFGISIPKIPYLAKGGIIDSPTLAMVGEQGSEAVVPLENNTGGLDILAEKLSSRMAGNGSNGTSPIGDITIQVGNDTLARILLSELKKIQRQTGEAVIKI